MRTLRFAGKIECVPNLEDQGNERATGNREAGGNLPRVSKEGEEILCSIIADHSCFARCSRVPATSEVFGACGGWQRPPTTPKTELQVALRFDARQPG